MKPTPDEAEALAKARMRAFKIAPYFSDAIYALIPWSVPPGTLPPGVGTAVTKAGILLYDSHTILNMWDTDDLCTGYLHEAEHVYRKHAARGAKTDDPQRWNVCCDAELADDLQRMGCKMLSTDVLPRHLSAPNGLTAEQYYGLNPSLPDHAGCGSGSGNPLQGEDELDLPAVSKTREAQLEVMRESVAQAVMQSGNASASLKRYSAAALQPPIVPWEARLSALARRAVAMKRGSASSTYSQINRRQGGLGFGPGAAVIAAPVSPIPNVCLVQDTSASVGDADVAYTLSQAAPILRAAGGTVTFIACDAKVHTLRKVSSVGEIRKSLAGGGSTDFRPVFDALRKLRNRPDVLVFSTDAYGTFPAMQPSWCRVIWLLQCSFGDPGPVPWGASIIVPKRR